MEDNHGTKCRKDIINSNYVICCIKCCNNFNKNCVKYLGDFK